MVGEELARKYGWKIGDRIPIGTPIWKRTDGTYNWQFDIVGIYHFKGRSVPSNEVWINYDYFDEARAGGNGTLSMYIVSIDRLLGGLLPAIRAARLPVAVALRPA